MNASAQQNSRTLGLILGITFGMMILAFASVPIYRKICQVTGWGGTTQEVKSNPFSKQRYMRQMTIRFNADIDPALPWSFKPDLVSTHIRIGQDGLISYLAQNKSQQPVTGTAVYNVSPLQAGKYFYKTQCFCFSEQTLQPGQTVHMPVTFFIDPKILEDQELKDLKTITLSYTFYPANSDALSGAIEKFINKKDNEPQK